MEGKIKYGIYHENIMDLYEFKHPEKLLSDLKDSSETDSKSSTDERSFDDSDTDLNDPESETVNENNNYNKKMNNNNIYFETAKII